MTHTFKNVVLLLGCLLVIGCATTDEIDPSDAKIAQLRNVNRNLQDRLSVLDQDQEDLQAQITQMKDEIAQMKDVLQENWASLRSSLSSLKSNQKLEIDRTIKNVMADNVKKQSELNSKLTKVVRKIQDQNTSLQQKVMADMSSNDQVVKSMRVQLNACMDKIDRIEKQIKILNSAQTPSKSGKSSVSTKKSTGYKKPKSSVKRTDKPSSSKVDYNQGYEHTVVSGETLWKIARDYNISVQDILNVNPKINDETFLSPGQKLFIPYRAQ